MKQQLEQAKELLNAKSDDISRLEAELNEQKLLSMADRAKSTSLQAKLNQVSAGNSVGINTLEIS